MKLFPHSQLLPRVKLGPPGLGNGRGASPTCSWRSSTGCPASTIDRAHVVVRGDVAGSLRRLVAALDAWLDASPLLSPLLWREADTHDAVRDALAARFRWMVGEIRAVMRAALPESHRGADVRSAAELLALAVSYRHSTARHTGEGPELQLPAAMHRELDFLAEALVLGAGEAR